MRARFLPAALPLVFIARLAIAGQATSASEPPEPPPAPLQVTPDPAPAAAPKSDLTKAPAAAPRTRALDPEPASPRTYRIAAWTGVGVTLAFITSGIVLGVIAQRDSDDLMRLLGERTDGKPPVYDADHQSRYTSLNSDGAAYNRATVACFIVAGIGAVTSGLLFWDATRRAAESKKSLALIPRPSVDLATGEARVLLSGRF